MLIQFLFFFWAFFLAGSFFSMAQAEEVPSFPTIFQMEKIIEMSEVILAELQYDGTKLFFTLSQDDRYWNKELWGIELKTKTLLLKETHAGAPHLSAEGLLAYEIYDYLLDEKEEIIYRAHSTAAVTDLAELKIEIPQQEENFKIEGWSIRGTELYLRKIDLDRFSKETASPVFLERGLYTWNPKTNTLTPVPDKAQPFTDALHSPDGKRRLEVIKEQKKDLWTLTAVYPDGNRIKIATSKDKETHSEYQWRPQVRWLNSQQVLVSVFDPYASPPGIGVLFFDFEKKKLKRVLEKEKLADFPLLAVSRDGQRLLFLSWTPEGEREGVSVLDIDKGNTYRIWENNAEEGEWKEAVLSPDGTNLLLLVERGYPAFQPVPFSRPPVVSTIFKVQLPEITRP